MLAPRLNRTILPETITRFNYIGNKFLTVNVRKELFLTAFNVNIEAKMYTKYVKKNYRIIEIPIEHKKGETEVKTNFLKHDRGIFYQLLIEKFFNR